jgi:hypothetical protein
MQLSNRVLALYAQRPAFCAQHLRPWEEGEITGLNVRAETIKHLEENNKKKSLMLILAMIYLIGCKFFKNLIS